MQTVTSVREITPNPDGTFHEVKTVGASKVIDKYGAGTVGNCPVCGSSMYGHFEVMPEGSRWCSACGYMWPKSALREFAKNSPVSIDDDDVS